MRGASRPSATGLRLLARWSRRDLRRRVGLVVLTALIIAVGVGTYAGLGGTSAWRIASQDESYERLRYHDLLIGLPENADVAAGTLATAVRSSPVGDEVVDLTERFEVPTQVDASVPGRSILVPGVVVGIPEGAGVDLLHVARGEGISPGDAGVVLEAKFARAHDLSPTGHIRLAGGRDLRYVGLGYAPEQFQIIGGPRQITGESGFAYLYADLATAQSISGRPDRVNQAVLRLRRGADRDAVAAELSRSLRGLGAVVKDRDDDTVRRSLYADARNDEKMWTALSLLVLLGASFASFNLVSRMVDAERHEIGVAMALGTPTARLALRPVLVGLQIALLGALLGVGVGSFIATAMRGLLTTFVPLPVWRTPFPVLRYLEALLAGIVLPLAAAALPIRRALRVQPVEALRTVAPTVRPVGLLSRIARPRHRGSVVRTMPARNLLRAPRRTLLTALGIGASITSLVAVLGLLDSLSGTLHRADAEVGRTHADRLEVAMSSFQPAGSAAIRSIESSPGVARATPMLRIGGTLMRGDVRVDTLLDAVDFSDTSTWRPSVISGHRPTRSSGLVISEKAAADLGVGSGDRITFEHPVRAGTTYRMVRSTFEVAGIHPNPLRFYTYIDASQIDRFGLAGIVDLVVVDPKPGWSAAQVQRQLFGHDGIGSILEVATFGRLLDERLGQLEGVLRMLEAFGLVLAFLIALNTASLTVEERRRDQATMFAFGLPVRAVVRTLMVETASTAVLGTVAGLLLGHAALRWLIEMLTTDTFPELGIAPTLTSASVVAVMLLGVGVAALAPVAMVRRLRRMDIPSTLRVLE